jgi:hypothetical protein
LLPVPHAPNPNLHDGIPEMLSYSMFLHHPAITRMGLIAQEALENIPADPVAPK